MRQAFGAVCAAPALAAASPLAAQPLEPSGAFLDCVAEGIAEERDRPLADMVVPITCGAAKNPPQVSCNPFASLFAASRTECEVDDPARWQTDREVWGEWLRGVDGAETIPDGGLFVSALGRRAGGAAAERTSCEAEIYWRDMMSLRSSDVRTALREARE